MQFKRRRSPPGIVLVAVLVALTVASVVFGSLLAAGTQQRRYLRQQQTRLQATVLAESGVERAAARLVSDAEYAGETWRVPAEEIGGKHAGRVEILVEDLPDQPQRRRVRVVARYPELEQPQSMRHSLEAEIRISPGRDER